MTEQLPKGKKIILFDGVCNLCDGFVQYVIKHDTKDQFRFVSLQSDLGKQILNHLKIDPARTDSVVFYEPGVAYFYKSDAVLEIARFLGGFFNFFTIFRIIPNALRNPLYDYVAKNRYQWYGKKDQCLMPTPALKAKFL